MDLNLDFLKDTVSEKELSQLIMLLSMDDEQFKTMSQIIIEQLEAGYSDTNIVMHLAAEFKDEGLELSDLYKIRKSLELELAENKKLSKIKKDFLLSTYDMFITAISSTGILNGQLITIPVELASEDAKIPQYAHIGDAGADVYSIEEKIIPPGETVIIDTGVKVAIPKGYELQVRPKSGISAKTALRIGNAPGTIDHGYRQTIGVIVQNTEPPIKDLIYNKETGEFEGILYGKSYTVEKGQKIAQLVLQQLPTANYIQVDTIDIFGEDRGGGFGSTGLK